MATDLRFSFEFGKRLCAALGIDPNLTQSVTLKMEAGGLPKIQYEHLLSRDQAEHVLSLIESAAWKEPPADG